MEKAVLDQTNQAGGLDRYGRRMIARSGLRIILVGGLLFGFAGKPSWPEAWVYLLFSGAFLLISSMVLIRVNPELINIRGRRPQNTPRFDKVILGLWMSSRLVMFILAGLDAGRMHWSDVPLVLEGVGFLLLALGAVLITWSMAVNTHFEITVRIQTDRGHQVCSAGPYGLVRHPGYTGVILSSVGVPLLLGSWPALSLGLFSVALFIVRTRIEDEILKAELPGYAEFAAETRYRLIPGVW